MFWPVWCSSVQFEFQRVRRRFCLCCVSSCGWLWLWLWLCVVVRVVVVCVCAVWCVVWHAEPLSLLRVQIQNASVCTCKTSPRVPAKRPHVFEHMRTCCRYTRERFECTHGRFESTHTGEGEGGGGVLKVDACRPHVELSLAPEVNRWIFTIKSLRIGREQHVPDS